MNLKILLPHKVLLEEPVQALTAEAADGTFTLLPGHCDFTSALVPSILSVRLTSAGTDEINEINEIFVAIDDGILVKKGAEILISTRHGVRSAELQQLRHIVIEKFQQRDERERKARTVLARLESRFMDRFVGLE